MTQEWIKVSTSYKSTFAIDNSGTDNSGYLWACGATGYIDSDEFIRVKDPGDTSVNWGIKFKDVDVNYYTPTVVVAAIDTNNFLWVCGDNNHGQLGQGNTNNSNVFIRVKNPTNPTQNWTQTFSKVSVNGQFIIAIDTDGYLWACGYNYSGQLGQGNNTTSNVFIRVKDPENTSINWTQTFSNVSVGGGYSMAIDDSGPNNSGYLWGCGFNYYGQLGQENTNNSNVFIRVKNSTIPTQNWDKTFFSVSAGLTRIAAIDTEGYLWGCGLGSQGGLGGVASTYVLKRFISSQDVVWNTTFKHVDISGRVGGIAIDVNNNAWGWGVNDKSELGNGMNTVSVNYPKRIRNASGDIWNKNFSQVSCGYQISFLLDTSGQMWVSGNNYYDASGIVNNDDRVENFTNTPKAVFTMTIISSNVSTGDTSNDSSISLTFTSSVAITDFIASDITVTNGEISNFSPTSSTVYTATFTPSGSGECTIKVDADKFTDAAGNTNIVSNTFTFTKPEPDTESNSITLQPGWRNIGQTTFSSGKLTSLSLETIFYKFNGSTYVRSTGHVDLDSFDAVWVKINDDNTVLTLTEQTTEGNLKQATKPTKRQEINSAKPKQSGFRQSEFRFTLQPGWRNIGQTTFSSGRLTSLSSSETIFYKFNGSTYVRSTGHVDLNSFDAVWVKINDADTVLTLTEQTTEGNLKQATKPTKRQEINSAKSRQSGFRFTFNPN